ncbi:MAG TPA: AsmA-like C-terminal region-containing protein [Bacteroidia bacterium]|nr:AsmA-like C-terminal region-containing protein [Bacteroidia bacterium]
MKSKVRTYLKIAAKISGIFALGVISVGLLIGFFYGDDIKKMIITELNKNLDTEIKVVQFEFSVFRHFPYASVDLEKVMAKGVLKSLPDDTLLYADRLSLLFDISSVFKNEIAIKKIVAKNGSLNIRLDKDGKNNYHFWKSSDDSTKASPVIDLQQILLTNMLIRYEDEKNDQHYLMKAIEAEISGKFSDEQFTLTTSADLFMQHFYAGATNYVSQKPVSIHSGIHVNTVDETYKFDKSRVKIAELEFDVAGNVISVLSSTILNLSIKAYEADLESFISMLPPQYVKYFSDYKSKGRFLCNIILEGKAGGENIPSVAVEFSIRNGTITPKESSVSLSNIDLNGSFRNRGRTGKSELVIPGMSAMLGGNAIKADLRLDDLYDPFLNMHASASLDLANVRHFISLDTLVSLNGGLNFNVAFAGKVKDVQNYSVGQRYKVQSSGTIELSNVSFVLKYNPLEYKNIQGKLTLQDNDLKVEALRGNISASDVQVTGLFKNFVNFIFIPEQSAEFNARLSSKLLDLDELLADKSSSSEDTSYIMKFNPRLYSHLAVSIGNLKFRKFSASRLQGNILLNRQVISGKELTFAAMDGMIYMDATINASRKDSILMSCDARVASLDITELFTQLENFGQATMTDQNVKGKINAQIQFTSSWTTGLVINPAKVRSLADITIQNGELNNFIPIQALAKYIKVPDLNHIKFSTIKNQISIADRKINIPLMEINSSALNLSASGVHDFNNVVDYRLQLLLSDVLGKKVKQNKTEFGEIEDDGLGRTKLLITMKGPIDNPRFGYDRKGATEKLKTDLATEKQTMKAILKEEFGFFKKDTIKVPKKPKKEEMQIDWEDDGQ